MRFFAVAFNFIVAASFASPPETPKKINFAGMVLTVSEEARRDIQKDIDLLCRHEKYFNVKAERAKTYFPIIEQIFEREGLPKDFKYLAIQESALIADATSSSKAVGFWQFKDNTAREVGMRVDEWVDERMSIVSSTIGAARYLKRSNQKLDNWIYSLQSYQMGLGGVMRSVGNRDKGVAHMDISADTYWYVKKFLAVKIAFENVLSGEPQFKVTLKEAQSKQLSDLVNETGHNEQVLRDLNKWIIKDVVPNDKSYFVVLPVKNINGLEQQLYAALETNDTSAGKSKKHPRDTRLFNGASASYAYKNESLADFSSRMDISITNIRFYNDLNKDKPWKSSTYYFLEPKKKKGEKDVTLALKGEDWWDISQRAGVRLKKLRRYNRRIALAEGQKIRLKPKPFLAFLRKRKEEILEPLADWDKPAQVQNEKPPAAAIAKPETVAPKRTETTKEEAPAQTTSLNQEAVKTTPNKNAARHLVQSGETLYGIAKKYNVAVDDIINWNALSAGNPIREGDRLAIMQPLPEKKEQVSAVDTSAVDADPSLKGEFIHEVLPKETLFSIARAYSVSVKELMEWNKKTDFSIAIGEKLKINRK